VPGKTPILDPVEQGKEYNVRVGGGRPTFVFATMGLLFQEGKNYRAEGKAVFVATPTRKKGSGEKRSVFYALVRARDKGE